MGRFQPRIIGVGAGAEEIAAMRDRLAEGARVLAGGEANLVFADPFGVELEVSTNSLVRASGTGVPRESFVRTYASSDAALRATRGSKRKDWMASSKRQTTMAKMARERKLQERREKKREKKQAARDAKAAEGTVSGQGDEDETDDSE